MFYINYFKNIVQKIKLLNSNAVFAIKNLQTLQKSHFSTS